MTLEEFKQSTTGQCLARLLSDSSTIARMEMVTREGRPAVSAIDADVAARVGTLNTVERQHIGRWVRDILGRRGLRPVKQLEWRGGKAFTSGAVYAPSHVAAPILAPTEAQPNMSVADRWVEARRLLLAARRDPDAPGDTVDAFLRDRRAMWREA